MEYKPGDIILMKNPHGGFSIHRLIAKTRAFNGIVITGGCFWAHEELFLGPGTDSMFLCIGLEYPNWPVFKLDKTNVLELLLYGVDDITVEELVCSPYWPVIS